MQRKSILMAVLIALIVTATSVHAQAIIDFPKLTGPYQVGKETFDWVDATRDEIFTDTTNDKREILVTIYYPAKPTPDAQPAPYAEGKLLDTMAEQFSISAQFIGSIRSHAYTNTQIAANNAKYPVVIFEPGWGAPPIIYSATLEDLASQGYIVAGIWSTYSSQFTVFPDGRVILANKAGSDPDRFTQDASVMLPIRKQVGRVWVDDARFVVDQMTKLNDSDPTFAGTIDTSHIGMFGHSFGGAAAIEAANQDKRFQAIVNLDGSPISPDSKPVPNIPFMLMSSDNPQMTDAQLSQVNMTRDQFNQQLAQYEKTQRAFLKVVTPSYYFKLGGSTHQTYISDQELLAEAYPALASHMDMGAIEATRAVTLYDTFIDAFFNEYLKGIPTQLLDGSSAQYPEVTIEAHLK